MWIVKNRKIFFAISGILMLISFFAIFVLGVKTSIDFSGGESFEFASKKNLPKSSVQEVSDELGIGSQIRELHILGYESAYIVRSKTLSDKDRQKFIEKMNKEGFELVKNSFIGPSVSAELKKKASLALSLAVLAIIVFVAWAFKEVSRPVSSWKYGLVAILALAHDISIPLGLFAVLGYFFGAEIDTLFVMALLAILGYSVNDTIVIFDRVRERLKRNKEKKVKENFEESVSKALESTIVRSINTSLTTAVVVLALFFLGPESIKYFALTLLAGILAGTYSSVFIAAPILVDIARIFPEKEKEKQSKKEFEPGVMDLSDYRRGEF